MYLGLRCVLEALQIFSARFFRTLVSLKFRHTRKSCFVDIFLILACVCLCAFVLVISLVTIYLFLLTLSSLEKQLNSKPQDLIRQDRTSIVRMAAEDLDSFFDGLQIEESEPDQKKKNLCYNIQKDGTCGHGDRCTFSHHPGHLFYNNKTTYGKYVEDYLDYQCWILKFWNKSNKEDTPEIIEKKKDLFNKVIDKHHTSLIPTVCDYLSAKKIHDDKEKEKLKAKRRKKLAKELKNEKEKERQQSIQFAKEKEELEKLRRAEEDTLQQVEIADQKIKLNMLLNSLCEDKHPCMTCCNLQSLMNLPVYPFLTAEQNKNINEEQLHADIFCIIFGFMNGDLNFKKKQHQEYFLNIAQYLKNIQQKENIRKGNREEKKKKKAMSKIDHAQTQLCDQFKNDGDMYQEDNLMGYLRDVSQLPLLCPKCSSAIDTSTLKRSGSVEFTLENREATKLATVCVTEANTSCSGDERKPEDASCVGLNENIHVEPLVDAPVSCNELTYKSYEAACCAASDDEMVSCGCKDPSGPALIQCKKCGPDKQMCGNCVLSHNKKKHPYEFFCPDCREFGELLACMTCAIDSQNFLCCLECQEDRHNMKSMHDMKIDQDFDYRAVLCSVSETTKPTHSNHALVEPKEVKHEIQHNKVQNAVHGNGEYKATPSKPISPATQRELNQLRCQQLIRKVARVVLMEVFQYQWEARGGDCLGCSLVGRPSPHSFETITLNTCIKYIVRNLEMHTTAVSSVNNNIDEVNKVDIHNFKVACDVVAIGQIVLEIQKESPLVRKCIDDKGFNTIRKWRHVSHRSEVSKEEHDDCFTEVSQVCRDILKVLHNQSSHGDKIAWLDAKVMQCHQTVTEIDLEPLVEQKTLEANEQSEWLGFTSLLESTDLTKNSKVVARYLLHDDESVKKILVIPKFSVSATVEKCMYRFLTRIAWWCIIDQNEPPLWAENDDEEFSPMTVQRGYNPYSDNLFGVDKVLYAKSLGSLPPLTGTEVQIFVLGFGDISSDEKDLFRLELLLNDLADLGCQTCTRVALVDNKAFLERTNFLWIPNMTFEDRKIYTSQHICCMETTAVVILGRKPQRNVFQLWSHVTKTNVGFPQTLTREFKSLDILAIGDDIAPLYMHSDEVEAVSLSSEDGRDVETLSKIKITEIREFLRGKVASWYMIKNGWIVQRAQASELANFIDCTSDSSDTVCLNKLFLVHGYGAGGTTVARLAMYELYRKGWVCLSIHKPIMDNVGFGRFMDMLGELRRHTGHFVLILVDIKKGSENYNAMITFINRINDRTSAFCTILITTTDSEWLKYYSEKKESTVKVVTLKDTTSTDVSSFMDLLTEVKPSREVTINGTVFPVDKFGLINTSLIKTSQQHLEIIVKMPFHSLIDAGFNSLDINALRAHAGDAGFFSGTELRGDIGGQGHRYLQTSECGVGLPFYGMLAFVPEFRDHVKNTLHQLVESISDHKELDVLKLCVFYGVCAGGVPVPQMFISFIYHGDFRVQAVERSNTMKCLISVDTVGDWRIKNMRLTYLIAELESMFGFDKTYPEKQQRFVDKDMRISYAKVRNYVLTDLLDRIGELNLISREKIVENVFNELDKMNSGSISSNYLNSICEKCAPYMPDVKRGKKTAYEVRLAFKESELFKKGSVTLLDFKDYYTGVNKLIKSDHEFKELVQNAWGVTFKNDKRNSLLDIISDGFIAIFCDFKTWHPGNKPQRHCNFGKANQNEDSSLRNSFLIEIMLRATKNTVFDFNAVRTVFLKLIEQFNPLPSMVTTFSTHAARLISYEGQRQRSPELIDDARLLVADLEKDWLVCDCLGNIYKRLVLLHLNNSRKNTFNDEKFAIEKADNTDFTDADGLSDDDYSSSDSDDGDDGDYGDDTDFSSSRNSRCDTDSEIDYELIITVFDAAKNAYMWYTKATDWTSKSANTFPMIGAVQAWSYFLLFICNQLCQCDIQLCATYLQKPNQAKKVKVVRNGTTTWINIFSEIQTLQVMDKCNFLLSRAASSLLQKSMNSGYRHHNKKTNGYIARYQKRIGTFMGIFDRHYFNGSFTDLQNVKNTLITGKNTEGFTAEDYGYCMLTCSVALLNESPSKRHIEQRLTPESSYDSFECFSFYETIKKLFLASSKLAGFVSRGAKNPCSGLMNKVVEKTSVNFPNAWKVIFLRQHLESWIMKMQTKEQQVSNAAGGSFDQSYFGIEAYICLVALSLWKAIYSKEEEKIDYVNKLSDSLAAFFSFSDNLQNARSTRFLLLKLPTAIYSPFDKTVTEGSTANPFSQFIHIEDWVYYPDLCQHHGFNHLKEQVYAEKGNEHLMRLHGVFKIQYQNKGDAHVWVTCDELPGLEKINCDYWVYNDRSFCNDSAITFYVGMTNRGIWAHGLTKASSKKKTKKKV